jgi:hypothetical protein
MSEDDANNDLVDKHHHLNVNNHDYQKFDVDSNYLGKKEMFRRSPNFLHSPSYPIFGGNIYSPYEYGDGKSMHQNYK